jgi:hypothetical protein
VRAIRVRVAAGVLDVYGIAGDAQSIRQREVLQVLADGDSRIRFLAPVASASVVETLSHYDLVAVPSQVLETGPLVVLEAFAAGVPVIGSALGGIADKVQDDVDGLLISPAGSIDAWRLALERCATDAPFLSRLRNGVRTPRSMTAVAQRCAPVPARARGAGRWQTTRARCQRVCCRPVLYLQHSNPAAYPPIEHGVHPCRRRVRRPCSASGWSGAWRLRPTIAFRCGCGRTSHLAGGRSCTMRGLVIWALAWVTGGARPGSTPQTRCRRQWPCSSRR